MSGHAVQVPRARVALSTSSCFPDSCTKAFETASRLGYDGVEVMVWTDPVSQDPEVLRTLADTFEIPVLAVHAPCLLITQHVWGSDPWLKLRRAAGAAHELGATTVVVHPPFRWQRTYAQGFVSGLAELSAECGVRFAVENMYPWRAGPGEIKAYLPGWNTVEQDYSSLTLDLSHTGVSGSDPLELLDLMGDRLAHLHLADSTGSNRDEHLVPGRGNQPCGRVLERLAEQGFTGTITVEISTRRAPDAAQRESDLAEALAFARLHLASPAPNAQPAPASPVPPAPAEEGG